jgi:hypothetical protein
LPAGTDAISGATISSAAYNAFIHDVETDLNAARPISSGGTGGTSAMTGLLNLGGETANQIVTNFSTQLWVSGSFSCALAGVTDAPVAGHRFAGVVCVIDAQPTPPVAQAANIVVEARDLDDASEPGIKWVRQKNGGTWGAWYQEILFPKNYLNGLQYTYGSQSVYHWPRQLHGCQ